MRYRLWPDHLDISAPTFKAWPYGRKQTAFVDERCPETQKDGCVHGSKCELGRKPHFQAESREAMILAQVIKDG